MELEFEGMDQLVQQLERIGNEAEKYSEEALIKAGTGLQKEVKSRAPVRTHAGGTLKANIELSEVENGEINVYVDQQGPAYYGYFLENGTSKMRARPFMYPAFHRSKNKMQREMISVLSKRMGLMP